MTTKDNSKPAFPNEPRGPAYGDRHDGMSLRDWFAGQALVGILSGYWSNPDMCGLNPNDISQEAYKSADAMLEAKA